MVSGFQTWATLATVAALGVAGPGGAGAGPGPADRLRRPAVPPGGPPGLPARPGASSTSPTTSRPISPPWASCSSPSGWPGASDRAPQLIHALAGGLAVGLTYTFGARLFGSRAALWGAAGLAATPLVPFLATRAYIDLFTVLFGLVAVCAVLLWHETGPRSGAWLRVAGGAAGLALATKYSALTLVLVLGAVVPLMAWLAAPGPPGGRAPGRPCGAATVFGAHRRAGGLALVRPPGGRAGEPGVADVLRGPGLGRGAGGAADLLRQPVRHRERGWRDWLLLPWNVYVHSWRFGHVPDAYPPLLALAIPLALLGVRGAAREGRWAWGVGPAGRWLL